MSSGSLQSRMDSGGNFFAGVPSIFEFLKTGQHSKRNVVTLAFARYNRSDSRQLFKLLVKRWLLYIRKVSLLHPPPPCISDVICFTFSVKFPPLKSNQQQTSIAWGDTKTTTCVLCRIANLLGMARRLLCNTWHGTLSLKHCFLFIWKVSRLKDGPSFKRWLQVFLLKQSFQLCKMYRSFPWFLWICRHAVFTRTPHPHRDYLCMFFVINCLVETVRPTIHHQMRKTTTIRKTNKGPSALEKQTIQQHWEIK